MNRRDSQLTKVVKGLRDFGYPNITKEEVEESFDRVKSGNAISTNVIDMIIKRGIEG